MVNPILATVALLIAILLMGGVLYNLYDRYHRPLNVVIAAGGAGGESYRFGEAIKDYLTKFYGERVTVTVLQTKGTAANLALLEAGEAHLATAQADVALDRWVAPTTKDKTHRGRAMAILYYDKIHLLSCAKDASTPRSATEIFAGFVARPERPRVYLPYESPEVPSGGQVETFVRLARYFGLRPGVHFDLVDDHGLAPQYCDEKEFGNVIFRVRLDGNRNIQEAIEKNWRLAPLTNIGALQRDNQALTPAWLVRGTYRIQQPPKLSSAEPKEKLPTLQVGRLLLARDDGSLPDFMIQEITRALNEEGPRLARVKSSADASFRQLFLQIPHLNRYDRLTALGVPLHVAAARHYRPQLAWSARLNETADTYSLF